MDVFFPPPTWPVVVSNLYNLKPGLLGPPGVLGDILGAIIIQDTGRPGGTNVGREIDRCALPRARACVGACADVERRGERWEGAGGEGGRGFESASNRCKPRSALKQE